MPESAIALANLTNIDVKKPESMAAARRNRAGKTQETPGYRQEIFCTVCENITRMSNTSLDLRNLPIKVPPREVLTEQFQRMHLGFDAAPAMVPGQYLTSAFTGPIRAIR